MAKKIIFLLVLLCVSITIISAFTIIKLVKVNNQLKESLPFLSPGESLESVLLLDKNARRIDLAKISDDKFIVYIFSLPCLKCNKNLQIIKRIHEIIGKKSEVIGIVPSLAGDAFEFEESANIKFKIYIPDDLNGFKQKLRLKLNEPQTIVFKGNHVQFVRLGDIDGNDFMKIIRFFKKPKYQGGKQKK